MLDEATAALDPESQDKLMELLSKQPEETTLVSVGHRPELEAFHNRKIVLERQKGRRQACQRHQAGAAAEEAALPARAVAGTEKESSVRQNAGGGT